MATQVTSEHAKQALFMYFSYAALTGMSDPDLGAPRPAGRSF